MAEHSLPVLPGDGAPRADQGWVGCALPGGLRVVAPLARGRMANVLRAVDESGTVVVVKILDRAFDVAAQRDRFAREAHCLRRLQRSDGQRAAPRLITEGTTHGLPFLALELLPGPTLAERLRAGPMPKSAAMALAVELIEALAVVHREGVVHRDVKPANLMDRPLKLIDFGAASLLGEPLAADTPLGTPAYLAPEQIAGEIDPRADLYAAAVVLCELLTHRRPFEGDAMALLAAHEQAQPRVDETLSKPMQALLRRMLAKRPDDRPSRATEILAALRQTPEAEETA